MSGGAGCAAARYVLLVEDDSDIRSTIADVLELEGYRVVTARNGRDALERLSAPQRPCLILLDLMMPGMNGWEFRQEQVRSEELASIPVVILSGDGSIEQKAASLQVAGHLRKPVQLEALLDMIRRYC